MIPSKIMITTHHIPQSLRLRRTPLFLSDVSTLTGWDGMSKSWTLLDLEIAHHCGFIVLDLQRSGISSHKACVAG
jgi:hypothetical protein